MIFSLKQDIPPYKFSLVGSPAPKLQIISIPNANTAILTALVGPAGPHGDAGPPGPPGASGDAGGYYLEYSPPQAQSTWVISHNFGRYPTVMVLDNTGNQVYVDIVHFNMNVLSITFPSAFMGTASLSA